MKIYQVSRISEEISLLGTRDEFNLVDVECLFEEGIHEELTEIMYGKPGAIRKLRAFIKGVRNKKQDYVLFTYGLTPEKVLKKLGSEILRLSPGRITADYIT